MPKIDKDGNMEFHSAELPKDYVCGVDPENTILRKKDPEIVSKRICKCGKEFVLHVEYDKTNPLHNLCDDCILKLPRDENQRYPEKWPQVALMEEL